MSLRKDIWHTAIVNAPIAKIITSHSVNNLPLFWLPQAGSYRFRADPFGIWRGEKLYLFCEYFDYRDKKGVIELFIYDSDYRLLDQRIILSEPWHLSYPYLIEDKGEIWMLPEAWRSGRLTLYKAVEFPYKWEAAHIINPGCIPIDATAVRYNGLWWLFYSPAWPQSFRQSQLYAAWAEQLSGPWHPYKNNPIHSGVSGSRSGGTPFILENQLVLPVQDCGGTYGRAVRPLYFDNLSREKITVRLGSQIEKPSVIKPFEGMHTLSAAGNITLIDTKYRVLTPQIAAVATKYALKKYFSKEWIKIK